MTNPSGTPPTPAMPATGAPDGTPAPTSERSSAARPPSPARQRWRLYLVAPAARAPAEGGAGRPAWPAILAETGLPLAGDAGGRGRVSVAAPLPLGVAGEREVVDVYLAERRPIDVVRPAIVAALPAGWSLVELHDVWVGAPAAPAGVVAADYRAIVAGVPRWALESASITLLGAATLPRERRREKKAVRYDLRPLLLRLRVRAADRDGVVLAMRLAHAPDAVGRPEEVLAALGEVVGAPGEERPAGPGEPPPAAIDTPFEVRSVVRERLLMADDPDPRD